MTEKKSKNPDKEPERKALTWRERMDPDIAGRRWNPDIRKGFGDKP